MVQQLIVFQVTKYWKLRYFVRPFEILLISNGYLEYDGLCSNLYKFCTVLFKSKSMGEEKNERKEISDYFLN